MSLTDRLFELEAALDRNDGDSEDDRLGRRMAFRHILAGWGDDRYQEGYGDGMRDVHQARHWAGRRAEEREKAETDKALSSLRAKLGTEGSGGNG